jgi:POT family proton-dependent oligopeptide transporter
MKKISLNKGGSKSLLTTKQPRALYLLFFAQLFESFSYYGMRSILLLYMVNELGYSDSQAYSIFTIYITLVEFNGIIGGYLADKFLGLRYSLYLGSLIIALGHICMALSSSDLFLYMGLSFIILGSGLFKVNCCALLGEFYQSDDQSSQSGFTIFYTGINIGAFIATLACAYLAEEIGFEYGFGLAAVGMIIGIFILYSFSFVLENKGLKCGTSPRVRLIVISLYLLLTCIIASMFYYQNICFPLLVVLPIGTIIFIIFKLKQLSTKERKNIYILLTAIMLLSLFYSFQEQIGSTFVLFIERCVDRNLFGFNVPSSSLSAINPCAIILIGFILARFFNKNQDEEANVIKQAFMRVCIAFGIIAFAYGLISFAAKLVTDGSLLSIFYPLMTFILIALAELFIGPTLYTLCIKLSPIKMRSQMLGVVMTGYALAGILSGYISQLMVIDQKQNYQALTCYSDGFLCISIIATILTIAIFTTLKSRKE